MHCTSIGRDWKVMTAHVSFNILEVYAISDAWKYQKHWSSCPLATRFAWSKYSCYLFLKFLHVSQITHCQIPELRLRFNASYDVSGVCKSIYFYCDLENVLELKIHFRLRQLTRVWIINDNQSIFSVQWTIIFFFRH